jgi:hypothetical protein
MGAGESLQRSRESDNNFRATDWNFASVAADIDLDLYHLALLIFISLRPRLGFVVSANYIIDPTSNSISEISIRNIPVPTC